MVEALLDGLGPVLTRWTMGGAAASAAPAEWRPALGEDAAEAELRLLALSGQYLGALVVAQPGDTLRTLPDLPRLALPSLPEALRPAARRLLETLRESRKRHDMLALLASRGWSVHPADWIPTANAEDVPEIYAPWRDWAALAIGETAAGPADEPLSAETWAFFGPAARIAALTELRRSDPAAARGLIEAKLPGESAEQRARLVLVLAERLSQDDHGFLASLAADRAPRVKALAASLLARLGHGPGGSADAAELADFFAIEAKGLLRRSRVISPRTLKTPAQRGRRAALFESTDLAPFAEALELPPEALIGMWPWGTDRLADLGLATMIERSAPDAIVAAAAAALCTGNPVDPAALTALLPRLSAAQRREAALAVLRGQGGTFQAAQAMAGCGGDLDDPLGTPAGSALLKGLVAEAQTSASTQNQGSELQAIGLLASHQGALRALERLALAGLLAADPRLDMLRLNAALEPSGHQGATG